MRLLLSREERLVQGLLWVVVGWMVVIIVLPLLQLAMQSVGGADGGFAGIRHYRQFLSSPSLLATIGRTFMVAFLTMIIAVVLGFLYAYALVRTRMPFGGLFRAVAMAPLFTPSMMHGIALIYLFGNKGVVTTGFFGFLPGLDINLYGPVGIVMAEVLYAFPQVVLILSISLASSDARLYDAARSLGASGPRTFFTVTLPGVKYGLISSMLVAFTIAFTDFGAPKVVGGQFSVLAVDIYKKVVGQQDFVMGAVISIVMLIPSFAAFLLEQLINRRTHASLSARSVMLKPRPHTPGTRLLAGAAIGMAAAICIVFLVVLVGSMARNWPYDFSLTWFNYRFNSFSGGGFSSYINSVVVALLTAAIGTVLVFSTAYLIERGRHFPALRRLLYLGAIFPIALPGTVIGIAFIFFFNAPRLMLPGMSWGLPNPLSFLYGTMALLVVANLVHFMPVAFITATSALKKLDREFESVSRSMGVPLISLLGRVVVPLCLPALLEVAVFLFVNAMITVSAVIFLYPSGMKLAAIAVVDMEDAGDTAAAAAMSVLILATNIIARAIYTQVQAKVRKRSDERLTT